MKKIIRICAHGGIVLSVVFMVFRVLHRYNPVMGFLTNEYSTPLLWTFCVLSLVNAIALLVLTGKD